ncbi:undecaprenyl/decaprenyl-phosphate alpha-N-acetylglucosaminyl 1-phosphate transferase [soil metagenome]
MIWIYLTLILIGSFCVSVFFTRYLVKFLTRKGLIDVPNARSSHKIPTPRGGGLAIIVSFLIGAFLVYILIEQAVLPGLFFFAGIIIIALTSFFDDKFDLPAYLRFGLHTLAAVLVIFETGGFEKFPLPDPFSFSLGIFNYPVTFFWIVAVINIYNFLDGIDGYAGTQAILAGFGIAFLDVFGAGFFIGTVVMASCLGFLLYNWHPAKIFMGDIGSATLGFIFATIPLYFTATSLNIGIYSIVIFLWFFLADGAFTIIRRAINGEKIWEAHRSHLYQQMVFYGNTHSKVVLMVMTPSLILTLSFLFLYYFYVNYLILSFILALIFFGYYLKRVMDRKRNAEQVE